MAYIELEEIDDTLQETYGNKGKTAELLELTLDQLLYKIKKYIKSDLDLVKSFPNIAQAYKRHIDKAEPS